MPNNTFRAAGWISENREHSMRLTDEAQASLTDDELIAAATQRFQASRLVAGTIEVGTWSPVFKYVRLPEFDAAAAPDGTHADTAESALQFGLHHPYDRRPPVDLAHWAAQGILADLNDRGGLDNVLGELDDDMRREIIEVAAAVVRRVMATAAD